MYIYLVRHGQDDDSVRGGWGNTRLTELGIKQSEILADKIYRSPNEYNIGKIISSDLTRAEQTALIISEKTGIDICCCSEIREVNNGDLAGMKNKTADVLFPDLFWKKLQWNEHYPNGESPCEFYLRIQNFWSNLVKTVLDEHYEKKSPDCYSQRCYQYYKNSNFQ